MSAPVADPVADGTRREFLVGGAALALVGLGGCGGDDASPAETTRTVKTDKGSVRVPADPQRIVVLSAGLAGYLFALDAPVVATDTRLLGVTVGKSGFPSLWSKQAERQGTKPLPAGDLDVEAVAAANPDLIVGGGQGFTALQAQEAYEQLTRIAPTALVSKAVTTWQDQLAHVAELVGAKQRAAELMRTYERRVAEVRDAIRLPRQPIAILLTTADSKPFVVPPEAALPALLTELGFTMDDVLRKAGGPKLYGTGDSFEVSVELLPDVADAPTLITISVGGSTRAELAREPIYARLPAFRRGDVHELPAVSYRPDYYAVLETLDLLQAEFGR